MSNFKEVNRKAIDDLRKAMYRADLVKAINLYDADMIQAMDRMISLARAHHKLAEAACNGDLTERQQKRETNIESEICELARVFGLGVAFGGDPRGFTVKLRDDKQQMYNTWGGASEGYGI